VEHGTLEGGYLGETNDERPDDINPQDLTDFGILLTKLSHLETERKVRSGGCSHLGSCESEFCSCSKRKLSCSSICNCRNCSNIRQGCMCEDCKVDCPCREAGYECDPGLCKRCGVNAILDPANRYDLNTRDKLCNNCMLQLDRPKRTFVGESSVHGWGLYAGEDIPSGGFIGRYKGELISKEQAERRDVVYQAIGRRYIFSVDEEHDIDAFSVGNKIRFINEPLDEEDANAAFFSLLCHSGIRLVGVTATQDIYRGQEIFVDYGNR
jgi:hypothetical protein